MILLHFAHRGEAQSFISHFQLKPLEQPFNGLYGNDEILLLVSGEGIYASLEKIAAVLGYYSKVNEVINLGICGILDTQVAKLDTIYSIGSIYYWSEGGAVFHSYHSDGVLDCVTCFDRVTNKQLAQKLLPMAPLVDRELWGVSRASKLFGKKFKSYKLTSDIAGSTDCMDIKYRALEFSQKLLEYFITHHKRSELPSTSEDSGFSVIGFHATFQQRVQLNKLLSALCLKYQSTQEQILQQVDINSIAKMEISDKQKTAQVLERLQRLLNPVKDVVEQKLREFSTPLTSIGAQVSFDPQLEKKEFSIAMTVNHQTNLDKLQRALSEVHFEAFSRLMDGNFDV